MPKSQNQKLKLFYLLEILKEETDEQHLISMKQILEKLETKEIQAERKSIYDDIEQLRELGHDIIVNKSRIHGGYYLASRDFELAELKMLVDAVSASKYITIKKSQKLIKKLESLCSKHEAYQLQRQVYVSNRIKTSNESVFYNVDLIHTGIQSNKMIAFQYFEWSPDKKLEFRKEGSFYEISPFALTTSEDNYYLIAFDHSAEMIKHYRVDKMKNLKILESNRKGQAFFKKFDLAEYSKGTFGMFGGENEIITLLCDNSMAGVIIDRFGMDVSLRNCSENTFKVRVSTKISKPFWGWISSFDGKIQILEPEQRKMEYSNYLKDLLSKMS